MAATFTRGIRTRPPQIATSNCSRLLMLPVDGHTASPGEPAFRIPEQPPFPPHLHPDERLPIAHHPRHLTESRRFEARPSTLIPLKRVQVNEPKSGRRPDVAEKRDRRTRAQAPVAILLASDRDPEFG